MLGSRDAPLACSRTPDHENGMKILGAEPLLVQIGFTRFALRRAARAAGSPAPGKSA